MKKKALFTFLFVCLMFGVAYAQGVDFESDPFGSLSAFVAAIKLGNWKLVAGIALAGVMMVLSKVRDKIKWFKGDRGGAVLVMVLSLAGALSTGLMAGAAFDLKMVLGAIGVAWTAVGGYTWLKRLIWPQDQEAA